MAHNETTIVGQQGELLTTLGKLVKEGSITSVEEIFEKGYKIKESVIVDILLPRMREEVLFVSPVQKQTDAGEKTKFRAFVVVGDENGHVGVGMEKAAQVGDAILKASKRARINIVHINRGCGSSECKCKQVHSIPFRVSGKTGSVRVTVLPAPKGLGLVAGHNARLFLRLAGVKDAWVWTKGNTSTIHSTVYAMYKALKKTFLVTEYVM